MFNAKEEKDKIIKFIRNYYKENNLGGVILGISGGKDSGVVAGLFAEALGNENIIGVTLPCHSKEEDKNDAKLVSDYYGFKLLNIDLTQVYDIFKEQINLLGNFTEEQLLNSDINVKPRLRMLSLYYLAPLFSAITGKNYIVYTDNQRDEVGNIEVYASIYNPDDPQSKLEAIETEKEWKVIETILNTLQEEIKNKKDNEQ